MQWMLSMQRFHVLPQFNIFILEFLHERPVREKVTQNVFLYPATFRVWSFALVCKVIPLSPTGRGPKRRRGRETWKIPQTNVSSVILRQIKLFSPKTKQLCKNKNQTPTVSIPPLFSHTFIIIFSAMPGKGLCTSVCTNQPSGRSLRPTAVTPGNQAS